MASTAAAPSIWRRGDEEVSLARLYAMRAVGLLGIYGLLPTIGRLVDHARTERGMLTAMVSGLWVMAFLIVRYPLKLVPLFLFEITWKLLWLIFFGLPQWWSGVGSPRLSEDLWSIGAFPIVCAIVIPWGYVWREYVKAPGGPLALSVPSEGQCRARMSAFDPLLTLGLSRFTPVEAKGVACGTQLTQTIARGWWA